MLPSPRPCGNPPRICGFRTPWRRPGRRVRDCGTAGASAAEPRTIARVRSLARPFVAVERRCQSADQLEATGEDEPVLDRHYRALREHRQGRVACVAEQ